MLNDYETWFYEYLLFGAFVVLAARMFNKVRQKIAEDDDFKLNLMNAIKETFPEKKESKTNVEDIVFVIIGFLLWPLAFLALLVDWLIKVYRSRYPKPVNPEDFFFCKREHLIREVDVEEVEANSYVHDPLGRVPLEPFGHLSPGWRAFLSESQPGYEMWSFKVPGNFVSFKAKRDNERQWSIPQDEKQGYAWVHKGRVKAEFFTQWD